ncbi:chaplin family protein [Streptomyces sp. Act143]|uniref:chaplin family protein n=1 Tax=Streptomyces sp. Act143 TaxID=2200760 RepID=UPI0015E7F4FF|nr:chaplin family protein [Streptomyces sp. Act143]
MRVIAGAVLATTAVAGPVVLGSPAAARAASFPCTPPEDACAVDHVHGRPGVGTGNVIQVPVDIDIDVRP